MPFDVLQTDGDPMHSLTRITIAPAVALALAAALATSAGAQEVHRPFPHGGGAPHQAGPHRGAAPHAFAAPNGPVQVQQPRRGGNGAGVAAGVIGGLAAGAILGGILSNRGPAVEPEVGPRGGCPLVRQPVYDGGGRFAGYQAVPSC